MSVILAVDDDPNVLSSVRKILEGRGHEVLTADGGMRAVELAAERRLDVALVDLMMAGMSGLETLGRLRELTPDTPVIILTAYGTTDTAIEALKAGAFDFAIKPLSAPALEQLVEKALAYARASQEHRATEQAQVAGAARINEDRLLGNSPGMYEVCKQIGQVANSAVAVLIRGESGTGKELVARTIHRHSNRARGPLVVVNCAALPETLLESELFGHEKGSFTGAEARRAGRFELAHGGTILLDEIGDLSPSTQVKILRVIQEKTFERLGATQTIQVDVRVLAATHVDLETLVRKGRFREDLYYRLKVVTIRVPPLRERKEDIALLARHFLERFCAEMSRPCAALSSGALERLLQHDWPGNLREFDHCLKQAAVACRGRTILPEHLQLDPRPLTPGRRAAANDEEAVKSIAREHLGANPGMAHAAMLEQFERAVIAEALRQASGNLSRAGRQLGISRPTMRDKILKYRLQREFNATSEESGAS